MTVLQKDFAALEAFYWYLNYVWCKRRCVIICSDVIVYSPHMRMFNLQLSLFQITLITCTAYKRDAAFCWEVEQRKASILVCLWVAFQQFAFITFYMFISSCFILRLDCCQLSSSFSSSFDHVCITCWCLWCFFNHVWWWSHLECVGYETGVSDDRFERKVSCF